MLDTYVSASAHTMPNSFAKLHITDYPVGTTSCLRLSELLLYLFFLVFFTFFSASFGQALTFIIFLSTLSLLSLIVSLYGSHRYEGPTYR